MSQSARPGGELDERSAVAYVLRLFGDCRGDALVPRRRDRRGGMALPDTATYPPYQDRIGSGRAGPGEGSASTRRAVNAEAARIGCSGAPRRARAEAGPGEGSYGRPARIPVGILEAADPGPQETQ